MSREYVIDELGTTYDSLLASLPPGITVRRGHTCLYASGVEHVLLADRCGNTLWMRKATDGEHPTLVTPGDPVFERWDLQGSMVHFLAAFRRDGLLLIDTLDVQEPIKTFSCMSCGEKQATRSCGWLGCHGVMVPQPDDGEGDLPAQDRCSVCASPEGVFNRGGQR